MAEAIEAAGHLFATRGIHGASVRDVAHEIGVSHTLLHRYFGTKEDLVLRVLASAPPPSGEPSAVRSLHESVSRNALSLLAEPVNQRVLAAALLEGYPLGGYAERLEAPRRFAQRLAEAQHSGEASMPEGVGADVGAACGGALMIGWAVARDFLVASHDLADVDRPELDRQIVEFLLRALGLESATSS